MAKKTKTPAATSPATTAASAAARVSAATTIPAPFRVFYSWQSDLPNNRNRGFIKDALEKAAKGFKEKTGVEMIVDEATSDTTGAVRIDDKIFEKIRAADYFVADLTPVDQSSKRMLPNPNVCIELGYAVAELGWERAGLPVNLAYGAIAELPFDIEKRRARGYTFGDSTSGEERQKAKQLLVNAFLADAEGILRDKPVKARLLNESNPEKIKRRRDVAELERIFSAVSLRAVDYFLEYTGGHYVAGDIDYFRLGLNGIVSSSQFHLYDEKLSELVWIFRNALEANLNFDAYLTPTNTDKLRFRYEHENPPNDLDEARKRYIKCSKLTGKAWWELLDYVRESYPEIDFRDLSQKAHQNYVNFNKRMQEEGIS